MKLAPIVLLMPHPAAIAADRDTPFSRANKGATLRAVRLLIGLVVTVVAALVTFSSASEAAVRDRAISKFVAGPVLAQDRATWLELDRGTLLLKEMRNGRVARVGATAATGAQPGVSHIQLESDPKSGSVIFRWQFSKKEKYCYDDFVWDESEVICDVQEVGRGMAFSLPGEQLRALPGCESGDFRGSSFAVDDKSAAYMCPEGPTGRTTSVFEVALTNDMAASIRRGTSYKHVDLSPLRTLLASHSSATLIDRGTGHQGETVSLPNEINVSTAISLGSGDAINTVGDDTSDQQSNCHKLMRIANGMVHTSKEEYCLPIEIRGDRASGVYRSGKGAFLNEIDMTNFEPSTVLKTNDRLVRADIANGHAALVYRGCRGYRLRSASLDHLRKSAPLPTCSAKPVRRNVRYIPARRAIRVIMKCPEGCRGGLGLGVDWIEADFRRNINLRPGSHVVHVPLDPWEIRLLRKRGKLARSLNMRGEWTRYKDWDILVRR